jgi:hypothetical protein
LATESDVKISHLLNIVVRAWCFCSTLTGGFASHHRRHIYVKRIRSVDCLLCKTKFLVTKAMYKTLTVVLLALIGIASAKNTFNIQHVKSPFASPNVRLDLCPTCINVADQSINILLNLILDSGIIGSCGALCSELATKTGSQLIGTICDLVCDVVGIEEFIKLIEKADLDPIWYCEIAKLCPGNDRFVLPSHLTPVCFL